MKGTFRYVGYSTLGGKTAVRYANSAGRARVLERNGHEFIELFDAGEALHPMDLVDLLLNHVESGTIVSKPAREAVLREARGLGFLI